MIDTIFICKLLLSFIAGAAFSALTLYAAQRCGPRIGGIIAGLPSTTAVGLFFIGYAESPSAASVASTIVPAAVGGTLVFVVAYVTLCGKTDYLRSLLASCAAWFAIALPLALLRIEDIFLSTGIFLLAWIVSYSYLKRTNAAENKHEKIVQSGKQIVSRGLFSGCIVALAVYASSSMGPLWGGTFAAFPAMFFSLFLVLGRSYGCGYTSSIARNTPLGLFAVAPYVWAVHFLYPAYGLIAGTICAYAVAFIAAGLIYSLTNRGA
jgi:hypothetical protein